MACFLVPLTEAVVTSVASGVMKIGEKKNNGGEAVSSGFRTKLGWLSKMLYGGSALLAFEHVWHGEVTPWAPFLTAAADPAARVEMFHEMSTVGVAMAVAVTGVWACIAIAASVIEKREAHEAAQSE